MSLSRQLVCLWLCLSGLVVLLGKFAQGFEGCTVRFGRRGCYYKVLTGVLVTCDGEGTEKQVPTNVPLEAVYMSLRNFSFDQLKRANFSQFDRMECLTIIESNVKGVESDAFADMKSLQELVLRHTQIKNSHLDFVNHPSFKNTLLTITDSPAITQISFNASKTLHNLQSLSFRSNNIDLVSPRIFSELRELQRLDLSHNRIQKLDWNALSELRKLNQLYLEGNQLQTIPHSVHDEFFSVKELRLADNPFHCNCKLRWLKDFFEEANDKTLDYEAVSCASPTAAAMTSVPVQDFRCSMPSPPKVTFVQLTDDQYVVNCTSHGDPAPNITLTLADGRTVITPPSQDLSKLDTRTPDILTASGGVICEAANSEGSSSSLARLPVIGKGRGRDNNVCTCVLHCHSR